MVDAADRPAAPAVSKPPPLSFRGNTDTLVGANFPDIYAGAILQPDGSETIYVTSRDPALLAAIASADTDDTKYRVVMVPNGHAAMMRLVAELTEQSNTLRSDGIELIKWGPDPSKGKVSIQLAKPTALDLASLTKATGLDSSAVTAETYLARAAALLRARFGDGLYVQDTYQEPLTLDHRRNDTPPFAGGDNITSPKEECTGGFPVVRNGTSSTFMLTAGHCLDGPWYIDETSTLMGNVGTGNRYYHQIFRRCRRR